MTEASAEDRTAPAALSTELLLDAVELLATTPSPPGGERTLADRVVAFGSERIPSVRWSVMPYGESSANVMADASYGSDSSHLGLYAHLDTSLTEDPLLDRPITGTEAPVPAYRTSESGDSLIGFGLSVAKAPAAAAIAALAAATQTLSAARLDHHISLLLAGGGTHRAHPPGFLAPGVARRPGFGAGVHHALDNGYDPDAVVNVKAAGPGVLFEEPGCMFVRVAVRGQMSPALLREKLAPDGGIISQAAPLLLAIESWRNDFVSRSPSGTQTRREAAVGAIRAGSPSKADLLPALLELSVYVVLAVGDDPEAVAADLESHVVAQIGAELEVDVYAAETAGATATDAPIVQLARSAWEAAFGAGTSEVSSWTGSTDGAIFRNNGIDTVRLGILTTQFAADPRLDVVDVASLVIFGQIYSEIAWNFATLGAGE